MLFKRTALKFIHPVEIKKKLSSIRPTKALKQNLDFDFCIAICKFKKEKAEYTQNTIWE
jgi:hypothetical protein